MKISQINVKQEKNKQNIAHIKKVTWAGLIINICLAAIKFIVGFMGSSQAVIADGVHSLSDLSTDFAVLIGVKYWAAPPDEEHPYGHRRIEALVTLAIGIILAFVAIGLGYNSLTSMRKVPIAQTTLIAIVGPLLSIIVKEFLFRWTVKVGKRVKSTAVIANAWHHRSDALSSLPVLIAVAISSFNPDWFFVDRIGALIVSIFILKISWNIISPSLSELTDHGASAEDYELIKRIVSDIDMVKNVHAIRTRKFGSNLAVDLHVVVDPEISVREGHYISQKVERKIINDGPGVIDVVVHIEPFENPS
jgi:cation diffusion facilitator family transporter